MLGGFHRRAARKDCVASPTSTPTLRPHRILFVASEAHPLIKTGGLGDVAGALPAALHALGQDVRLLLPAYREALQHVDHLEVVGTLRLGAHPVRLLSAVLPGSGVPVWLVDSPPHFDRPGNPYVDENGRDWPDNAERYAVFARAATAVALDQAGLGWQPTVVHGNDWQSGLVPALLSQTPARPATVFTVHNLAYQGLFPLAEYQRLDLPMALWSLDGLEFYGQASYMKAGLAYADMLSTVSPTYAREVCTPEFGCGLDGLLRQRADLLRELGLPRAAAIPLVGFVGRLVEQKGSDLVLAMLPELLHEHVQIIILGSGSKEFEQALTALAAHYPR